MNVRGPLCTIQRLKPTCYQLLLSFAFSFNLCRYNKALQDYHNQVGCCKLTYETQVETAWNFEHLKLKCDKLLSTIAFKFNLCRYNQLAVRRAGQSQKSKVGLCRLTLSNPC
jgi:hypothetical protein